MGISGLSDRRAVSKASWDLRGNLPAAIYTAHLINSSLIDPVAELTYNFVLKMYSTVGGSSGVPFTRYRFGHV